MNILLTYLFRIQDKSKYIHDYSHYTEMAGMCLPSFMENLVNLDEVHIVTGEAETSYEMYRKILFRTLELSAEGHNILRVDLDTVCMQPTEIFDRFSLITMFGLAKYRENDERIKRFAETSGQKSFEASEYYNAGVLFVPANLPTQIHDLAYSLAETWDRNSWSYLQWIWNCLRRAHYDLSMMQMPELNYAIQSYDEYTADEDAIEAHILHFHSSRNAESAVKEMRKAHGVHR